jgi:hypothetical protein
MTRRVVLLVLAALLVPAAPGHAALRDCLVDLGRRVDVGRGGELDHMWGGSSFRCVP